MIVGTAGHIDHGKTTLTRALTGVDTDRLKEEKARGISIELGYAYLPLDDGLVLGVIDVPGHEKFIRTMAAGVTGIDYALLAVAADDGIMPQTLEHLSILRLLGVRRGAVALTKADRADPARLAQVEGEVRALLSAMGFDDAPLFRTNATAANDAGVAALLAHLSATARQLPARDEQGLFRLGVDRVFTLAGQGTVVTGTALAGAVRVGDLLRLAPGGRQVRVRGIHAQNRAAERGMAGQRLALNLGGAAREDIDRGSWVVAPALADCGERLDAELSLLAGAGAPLASWSPLHVHLGAAHRTAHVVPLDGDILAPGHTGRVQLVLDAPVHAAPGDRFIIRNAQASATIGGGVVLDPFAPARKRRSAERLAWLQAMSGYLADGGLAAPLACSPHGLRASTLTRLTLLPADRLTLPPDAMRIALAGGDALLIARASAQALQERAIAALAQFHARAPDEAGPEWWRLKRMVAPDAEDKLWSDLLEQLIAAGRVCQRGRSLHLPEHRLELSPQEQALAAPLLASLLAGSYDPPWVRDLARKTGMAEDDVRRLLRKLNRSGDVGQVVPDLFYHPARLAELARIVATLPEAQAASFRDATALGRKRAIQLLEYFDRVGYTRRVGNIHLVRPNAVWS
ncbi:selenocysteine-specific translation elongation factor [Rugamonas apoptosis]|uniref:Selenocysteine-specific elongation factor n=1 Tax=Rugamonas apoptosis TaxID=2758570 RepID=A0A7W2IM13_9BURK|nr:selenocysteine-specific translation elongation factor [Rugamonas apoptosis]MBA5689355.1 selenocysteine-specific translation elongation factor [Rugamonas apoptosis]